MYIVCILYLYWMVSSVKTCSEMKQECEDSSFVWRVLNYFGLNYFCLGDASGFVCLQVWKHAVKWCACDNPSFVHHILNYFGLNYFWPGAECAVNILHVVCILSVFCMYIVCLQVWKHAVKWEYVAIHPFCGSILVLVCPSWSHKCSPCLEGWILDQMVWGSNLTWSTLRMLNLEVMRIRSWIWWSGVQTSSVSGLPATTGLVRVLSLF